MAEYDPLVLLRVIALGHEPPPPFPAEDFYRACDQATRLITEILPRKTVDVYVEGPDEFLKEDPLLLLFDFVQALQRNATDGAGITDPDDSLGLAQLAIHRFVNSVLPHCQYRFQARFTRPSSALLLPARGSWGRHVANPTKLLRQDNYTPFKEVPPS